MPTRSTLPGVLCLEGEWADSLRDRRSVLPVLDLLAHTETAQYVHRRTATSHEFFHQLNKWLENGFKNDLSRFHTIFIATHGHTGHFQFDDDESISLSELGAVIDGRASNCYIYFGSCGTMSAPDSDLEAFRRKSGALAVVGYTETIEWLESAAFEAILIEEMVASERPLHMFNRLQHNYGVLVERLGLVVVTSSGVRRA
ncbi:DUF6642 family protein [Gordonia sp. (in: high G+C Gram-positive bacteria)]|uniref:DUF6642 family protein n=1 Tax=Gordonia sp. (in: high G+C Gram-positive bacteria) TaxID=84139 RepID=UPI003C745847